MGFIAVPDPLCYPISKQNYANRQVSHTTLEYNQSCISMHRMWKGLDNMVMCCFELDSREPNSDQLTSIVVFLGNLVMCRFNLELREPICDQEWLKYTVFLLPACRARRLPWSAPDCCSS